MDNGAERAGTYEREVECSGRAVARDHGPERNGDREDVARPVLAVAGVRLRGQEPVGVRLGRRKSTDV